MPFNLSFNTISCYFMSRQIMSRHNSLCDVILCQFISCYIASGHFFYVGLKRHPMAFVVIVESCLVILRYVNFIIWQGEYFKYHTLARDTRWPQLAILKLDFVISCRLFFIQQCVKYALTL